MKTLLILVFLIPLSNASSQVKNISLEEVAAKVKNSNFNVLENAERVYQAKETITFNKRNLLPRLNFWNVLRLPFDWLSAVDIVQDIAPFLVPNNWFRVSQSKLFFLAQKEQYRALWANEVMTAKLLYINTLRDQGFLSALELQEKQVSELLDIVKTRSIFGDVPPQVLKFLQIRKLEIVEDLRALGTLVFEEKKALAYLMGTPQEEEIALKKIELPKVEELDPIKFDTFIFRALDNAPEITQYRYIKSSLKFVKKEVYFSFLGASTGSRGVGGGIFNNIPIQDGLGFGLGSSLRISKSEGRTLDLNIKATKEVIKKNLYNLVTNFNSYIENVNNQNNRLKLAEDNYEVIKTQLLLGTEVDPIEMLTSISNLFDASISLTNYRYEVVTTIEKIQRTIFNGDYSMIEGKLNSLVGEKQ